MEAVELKTEEEEVATPDVFAEQTLTKPPKKPRSEKQIAQFEKCRAARSEKCKQIRDLGLLQPPKVRRDHVYNLQTEMLHKQDEFLSKMNGLFDEFSSLKQQSAGVVVQSDAETSEFEMPTPRKPPKALKKKKKATPEPIDSESEDISGPQPEKPIPPPIQRQGLSFV